MALGIPYMLSHVDGLKEVVGDTKTALMCQPDDSCVLADALWHLYNESWLGYKIGQAGKKRIYENFDIPHSTLTIAKFLSSNSYFLYKISKLPRPLGG